MNAEGSFVKIFLLKLSENRLFFSFEFVSTFYL